MDPNELVRTFSSSQEPQNTTSELDDAAVDQLLESLLVQESVTPATRSTDLLGSLLGENAGAETANRLDLTQLLGQPDLKEKLTRLLMEKFKLPEAMAATLAEAIMKNVSQRKSTRRKTSSARKRKTSKQTKPKRKTTSPKKPKRKTSSPTSTKKESSTAKKKKTSKSAAKKKTSRAVAKKKTGSRKARSREVGATKPEE